MLTQNTNRSLLATKYQAEGNYWRACNLAGYSRKLLLADQHMLKPVEGYQEVYLPLETTITERLRAISKNADQRLYALVVAAMAVLQSRLSSSDHVITGTQVPGDLLLDREVNQHVPLALQVGAGASFRDIVISATQGMASGIEHQRFPVDVLLDTSEIPALFDVYCTHSVLHGEAWRETMPAPLVLHVEDQGTEISIRLAYDAAVYTESKAGALLGYYTYMLEQMLAEPSAPLSQVRLLTPEQEQVQAMPLDNRQVGFPAGETITGRFEQIVQQYAERIAVSDDEAAYTYAQLDARANALAHALLAQGVKKGNIVAILMERTIDQVVAILATLKAGACYMPVDPRYPQDRRDFMLSDSEAVIVIKDAHTQVLETGSLTSLTIEQVIVTEENAVRPTVSINSDDAAYIIYTSGTTGKPKGVIIGHKQVIRLFFTDQELFDFGPEDIWTIFHSFCFDFSVWELYGAILYGGKARIISYNDSRDPKAFFDICQKEGVTVLNQTPSAFYSIAELAAQENYPTLAVRYVIYGGEALHLGRLRGWKEHYSNCALINMYGITETTVHVTYREIGLAEIEANRSVIGLPIPTLAILLLDEQGNWVAPGMAGEIYVGGEGLAIGYHKRPELNEAKFVVLEDGSRWYRSGDLGRYLQNGDLEYLGRIDTQVQLKGFRVELGEIESRLLAFAGVNKTAVLMQEDEQGESVLVAYFMADDAPEKENLRHWLGETLPNYMIPSYFVQCQDWPLTANGKLNRKELPDFRVIHLSAKAIKPATEMEERVHAIMAEALGLEEISVTESFFSTGGDSIKGIRFLSLLNKAFGTQLRIPDLYTQDNIRALAAYLATIEAADTTVGLRETTEEVAQFAAAVKEKHPQAEQLEDAYPMSDVQKGMVFHSLQNPGSGVYHDQMLHQLEVHNFDPTVLQQALADMQGKHPILRTAFNLTDFDEPALLVFRQGEVQYEHHDLRSQNKKEQEDNITQVLTRDRNTALDLQRAGIWRVYTFQRAEDKVLLLFVCHHAIIDGWSDASFNTELFNRYAAIIEGTSETMAPLASDYKAYVLEERRANRDEQTLSYWKEQLEELTEWPLYELGEPDSDEMKAMTLAISPETYQSLQAKTKEQHIALKDLCFASYCAGMATLNYQKDNILGYITNNRPVVEDGDKILGCFLNSIPFRYDWETGKSVQDFVTRIVSKREKQRAFEQMSYYKMSLLADNRSRLFEVIFNYIDFHVYDQMDDYQHSDDRLDVKGQVRTDTVLNVNFDTTGGLFQLFITWQEKYYSTTQIEQLAAAMQRFLDMYLTESVATLTKAALIGNEQVQKLIAEDNNTQREYPAEASIQGLFAATVAASPAAQALVHGTVSYTYAQLDAESNKVAAWLSAQGLQAEEAVGLHFAHPAHYIIAVTGVLKAGGSYLPLDLHAPALRKQYMIEDATARFIIADEPIEAAGSTVISWESINTAEAVSSHEIAPAAASQRAYIMYTSGSTGQPKGVEVLHRNVVRLVKNNEFLTLGAQTRILQTGAPVFDATTIEIWGVLLNGGTLVVTEKENILDYEKLGKIIRDNSVNTIWLTSSLCNQLADQDIQLFAPLHTLMAGGDALSPKHINALRAAHPSLQVINGYGPTENTTFSLTHRVEKTYETAIPIGYPISNSTAYIFDVQGELLAEGMPGELYVGGDGVARGYLNQPELTAEKYVSNPLTGDDRLYKTGDLVHKTTEGPVQFLGRIDQQVKIRGYRIELSEIEAALAAHPAVARCVVMALERQTADKYLCAWWVAAEETNEEQLRAHIAQSLPEYMIPAVFVKMDALPLTTNGKTDRKALPMPEDAQEERSFTAPTSDKEEQLLGIWQSVLGSENIGTEDNFFTSGGDSIKAIQIMARIKSLGFSVEMKDIFQYPTVRDLAPQLKEAQLSKEQGLVTGEFPLTPIMHHFFEGGIADKSHFNQAVLLASAERLKPAMLEFIFGKLLEHHDALRIQVPAGTEGLQPVIAAEVPLSITSLDLREAVAAEQQMMASVNELHASIDLATGPLIKIGHYQLAKEDRLLITIHHMAIDGVSWRILFEDIEALYQQYKAGKEAQLPPKTDSFKTWANAMQEYATSAAMQKELDYWTEKAQLPLSIPVDHADAGSHLADFTGLSVTLDQETTTALTGAVHEVYNTEVNDLLLSALLQTLQAQWGLNSTALLMEGHGRESLVEDIDISRTVGWFTAAYPVVLEHPADGGTAGLIKSVKEQLRNIPNKGVGFGLLRYAAGEGTEALSNIKTEIVFNYLGQFDQDTTQEQRAFRPVPGSLGQMMSPEGTEDVRLFVTGMISEGQLTISIRYNTTQYKQETISRILDKYKAQIEEQVRFCLHQEEGEYTVSDFSDDSLNDEDLDAISALFD